jgi:hypothetical protein
MDELTMMIVGGIALGPFYAAGVAATWWGLNFGWHMLRRVDESTKKTELTETLTTKNGSQMAVK